MYRREVSDYDAECLGATGSLADGDVDAGRQHGSSDLCTLRSGRYGQAILGLYSH